MKPEQMKAIDYLRDKGSRLAASQVHERVAAGFAVYLVASVGGSLLWTPLLPAMLALVYRDRAATVGA